MGKRLDITEIVKIKSIKTFREQPVTYVMSDIHGDIMAFKKAIDCVDWRDGRVILLGDYLDGPEDGRVMELVREIATGRPSVVLLGNHEEPIWLGAEPHPYARFIKSMPLFTETKDAIFAHAGVNEAAGEDFRTRTDEGMFLEKYPPQFGSFYKPIVSGHVGTASIRGNDNHHILYDGQSHYYIDGSVAESGVIPVLKIQDGKFYEIYDGQETEITEQTHGVGEWRG